MPLLYRAFPSNLPCQTAPGASPRAPGPAGPMSGIWGCAAPVPFHFTDEAGKKYILVYKYWKKTNAARAKSTWRWDQHSHGLEMFASWGGSRSGGVWWDGCPGEVQTQKVKHKFLRANSPVFPDGALRPFSYFPPPRNGNMYKLCSPPPSDTGRNLRISFRVIGSCCVQML